MKNYEHTIRQLKQNSKEYKEQIKKLSYQLELALQVIKELKCN